MAPQMSVALRRFLAEPEQVVLRYGQEEERVASLLSQERARFAPNAVVLALSDKTAHALSNTAPFLSGLDRKGSITVFRCRNFACELPQNFD